MMARVHVGNEGTLPLSASVMLDADWTRLRLRATTIEARLTLPPILLLDKPAGVVTSRVGEQGAPTVFDGLPPELAARLQPVGRLDKETTGLLLLVADGQLIQRLAHPKRAVPRTYIATLDSPPDPAAVEKLRAGELDLKDGHRPHPETLERLSDGRWSVTLTEGKYHEVRRLFAAAGSHVHELQRIGFAGFSLDDLGGLPLRRLEETEVSEAYRRLAMAEPETEVEVREVHEASPNS
jgi:16S rRNA pseudouridine516 synthase